MCKCAWRYEPLTSTHNQATTGSCWFANNGVFVIKVGVRLNDVNSKRELVAETFEKRLESQKQHQRSNFLLLKVSIMLP